MTRLTIIDDDTRSTINLVLLFLWCFVEVGRIYTGYYGNVKESVDEGSPVPGNAHFHCDIHHQLRPAARQPRASVERGLLLARASHRIRQHRIHPARAHLGVEPVHQFPWNPQSIQEPDEPVLPQQAERQRQEGTSI